MNGPLLPLLLWAEFPIQFLIPAIFLVIWALNQVFGREQPPPAAGRREPIRGPRREPAGPSRAPRPPGPRPNAPRAPTPRWPEDSDRRESPGRSGRSENEDDILMIPPVSPSARRSGPSDRGEEARTSRGPSRRRTGRNAEALGAEARSLIEGDATPLGTTGSLGPPVSPQGPFALPAASVTHPTVPAEHFRSFMTGGQTDRLREALVLSEILQPPVALRHRRPGR